MTRRSTLPACALVLAVCSRLAAAATGVQTQTFEERTRVFEVQIPVNVTDRSGRPVRGLTAADFLLLDQGKEQRITSFEVVDLDLLMPSGERVMDLDYDIPRVARRHVLFLFDLSFSSPVALVKARRAAQRFVLDGLHPSDLAAVAVHSIEAGSQLLLTFTPDRAQLARSITTLGNPRLLKLAVRDPLRFIIDSPAQVALQATLDVGGVAPDIARADQFLSGYLQVIGNRMAKMERSYARGQISSEGLRLRGIVDG